MFKFNFDISGSDIDENEVDCCKDSTGIHENTSLPWKAPDIYKPDSLSLHAVSDNNVNQVNIGKIKIIYINPSSVESHLQQTGSDDIKSALNNHSDLIPSVYEGGLKIWECTWDLIDYLSKSDFNFKNLRVLELGCGAGLPAIYAGLRGSLITLQDYNEEVIKYLTVPNVLLNLTSLKLSESIHQDKEAEIRIANKQAKFLTGDWNGLDKLVLDNKFTDDGKYDLILTSETIYNTENQPKLLETIIKCLKKTGTALIAAKSCYFGVGGTTAQFLQLIKEENSFLVDTVLTNDKGLQREILILKYKENLVRDVD